MRRRSIPLALGLFAALLAAWSWRRWPDVQVDFGRELYAPWRLVQGERLYRDLAWFNGPLSAHWNALWFALFGVSLGTLVWVNLALIGATLGLLVTLVRRWSGKAAAAATGFVFLGVFAFGRYAPIGNYNFVTPYSHELTHGLVLSLAALVCLGRLGRGGRRGREAGWAGAAGLLLGLAFLTKAEVFLAGAGAGLVRLGLHLARPGGADPEGEEPVQGQGHRARTLTAFLLGILVPPAVAWAGLASYLTADEAARATLGSWLHLGDERLRSLPFYSAMSGMGDPARNLGADLSWAAGYLAVVALFLGACWRLNRDRASTAAACAVAFVAGLLPAALGAALGVDWDDLARPFPLFLALIAGVLAVRWWRAGDDRHRAAREADHLAFVVLAGLLLLKVLLHARIKHYGFVLGLPATLVLVALVVDGIPAFLEARGRPGAFFRAAALGSVTLLIGGHLVQAQRAYHGGPRERVTVGRGGDRFLVGWRGGEVRAALEDLDRRLPAEGTLLVVPEGVMLNYLLRRASPTPFVNFMPPELILWGERAVVDALEAHPPDAVAVVHKDTREYGESFFGSRHYGRRIMAWIEARYAPAAQYGAQPLRGPRFGISILVPR